MFFNAGALAALLGKNRNDKEKPPIAQGEGASPLRAKEEGAVPSRGVQGQNSLPVAEEIEPIEIPLPWQHVLMRHRACCGREGIYSPWSDRPIFQSVREIPTNQNMTLLECPLKQISKR